MLIVIVLCSVISGLIGYIIRGIVSDLEKAKEATSNESRVLRAEAHVGLLSSQTLEQQATIKLLGKDFTELARFATDAMKKVEELEIENAALVLQLNKFTGNSS